MTQWSLMLWCWCGSIVCLISDLTYAQDVQKCFLYPVEAKNYSPGFPLSPSGDTIITINNIYHNNTWFTIMTDKDVCVAEVLLNNAARPSQQNCSLFNCSTASPGELLSVVVRRGEGQQTVQVWDCFTNEQDLLVNLTDSNTLQVTSEEFINVAYDCPNRCFQFENATIHKNFNGIRNGSLLLYGRATGLGTSKWNYDILKGEKSWDRRKYVRNTFSENNCWLTLKLEPEYINKNNKLKLYLRIKYETASSCRSEVININMYEYIGKVPNEDLYINFKDSENVRWATLCRPLEENLSRVPGEPYTPLVSYNCPSSLISVQANGTVNHQKAGGGLMWYMAALGVTWGLTLALTVVFTATVCYRQRASVAPCKAPAPNCKQRKFSSCPAPPNTAYLTSESKRNDEPSVHYYELPVDDF